jgi:hypothetical protein
VELKFEFKDKAQSPDRVYRGNTVLEAFEAWLGKRSRIEIGHLRRT